MESRLAGRWKNLRNKLKKQAVVELFSTVEEADEFCRNLRQGHVLGLANIPKVLPSGAVGTIETPHGVVIVSQTCDVVLRGRPQITVAKVIEVEESEVSELLRGKKARYYPLEEVGPNCFASFDEVAVVSKQAVVACRISLGIDVDDYHARSDFSRALSRHFGRYAFPDEFSYWIQPFEDVVIQKYAKPHSFEAKALRAVREFRLEEANGWRERPYAVTLHAVLEGGTLWDESQADGNAEEIEPSSGLLSWLYSSDNALKQSSADIAQGIMSRAGYRGYDFTNLRPADRNALWDALVESWASRCRPKSKWSADPWIMDAVEGGMLQSIAVSEEDFNYQLFRTTAQLDVDFVSNSDDE